MNKTVILRGAYIDGKDNFILKECLKIMFPDCEIAIHSNQHDKIVFNDEVYTRVPKSTPSKSN